MKTPNKIIHIADKQDSLVNFLKDLLKRAENGEITKIMTVSDNNLKGEEDTIMSGYYECDFMTRQIFISTLQLDLSYQMVEANVDKLIEFINK